MISLSKVQITPEIQDTSIEKIDPFEKLRQLTEDFRSNLSELLDSDGKPKLVKIDGIAKPLLRANGYKLQNYIEEYTGIWIEQSDEMKREMNRHWFIDCRGLYIDGGYHSSKYKFFAPIAFDYSEINTDWLFRGKIFTDFASFVEVKFIHDADFSDVEFRKKAIFDRASFSGNIIFSHVKFFGLASFQRITDILGSVDFSNTYFHRAPLFHESKLPQGTSFDEAIFDVTKGNSSQKDISDDARAFRTLKQIAVSYKGQQDEADFFALEQKARRIAFLAPHLVWSYATSWEDRKNGLRDLFDSYSWQKYNLPYWSIRWNPIEWFISLAYDWVSGYGRHPDRALSWFIIFNAVITLLYHYVFIFSDNLSTADYYTSQTATTIFANQYPALCFTLQNLLSPSAVVSYKALIVVNNPLMLFLAVVQSSFSYIILVLLALAIRARFQKGN